MPSTEIHDGVLVVGAGASGILAAWRAACLGARVLLLEKTDRVGTKILISGGGKCNITHDGPIEDVLRAFRPNEGRFIRPACYRFPNTEIVRMLTDKGLEVYTRPDGRIFPVDRTAKDVVRILASYLDDVGVEVRLRCAVRSLIGHDGCIRGVRTDQGEIHCDRVVLTVGGASYPNCGTNGDGWPWLSALGHSICPLRPALAPIHLKHPKTELAGVALRNVTLKARAQTKEADRFRGDLLFTHHGVSGPCALGVSRVAAECLELGHVDLVADLLPDHTFDTLTDGILKFCQQHPRKGIATWLEPVLPRAAFDFFFQQARVELRTPGSSLDRKSRNRMVETVKALTLGEIIHIPMEKGEVVAGGVDLAEVDPMTLRSRRVKGLWLAGEILDVAGPVGGYNLQAAWATGFVAGENVATNSS